MNAEIEHSAFLCIFFLGRVQVVMNTKDKPIEKINYKKKITVQVNHEYFYASLTPQTTYCGIKQESELAYEG